MTTGDGAPAPPPVTAAAGGPLVPAPSSELVETDLSPGALVERATVVGFGLARMLLGTTESFARRVVGAPSPAPAPASAPPDQGLAVLRVVGLGAVLEAQQVAVTAAGRAAAFGRGVLGGAGLDAWARDLRAPRRGPLAGLYRRGAAQWAVADERAHAVLRGSVDGAVGSAVATVDLERVLTVVLSEIDLDALITKVLGELDIGPVVDGVLDEIDLAPVVDRVIGQLDLAPIVNRVLDELDLGSIVDKVLSQMDMAELTEQLGVEEIISSSTRSIAASTLDFVRDQGADADDRLDAVVARVLRRRRGSATPGAARAGDDVDGQRPDPAGTARP